MARQDSRNTARYWRDQRVPGLTLLCADFTTHEYALHSHDALVIAITEQGGAEVKSRGKVEQAQPSALFVFNPAEPHAGWMGWSQHWRYRSLYLTQSALDDVAEGLGLHDIPYFMQNRYADDDLIKGFLRLHHALQASADALQEEELLLGSFGELFQRHGSGAKPLDLCGRDLALQRRVATIMQERYDEPLLLADLSQAVGLRKVQLIDLFNRTTGMGPHAYLNQVRLKAACRRLKQGDALAEVATACGFYDQSAMNRHFKRAYGITPLQYAQVL